MTAEAPAAKSTVTWQISRCLFQATTSGPLMWPIPLLLAIFNESVEVKWRNEQLLTFNIDLHVSVHVRLPLRTFIVLHRYISHRTMHVCHRDNYTVSIRSYHKQLKFHTLSVCL